MKTQERKFLFGIPSWGLALLAAFFTVIVLMILGFLVGPLLQFNEIIAEGSPYVGYAIIITIASFFICKHNPKSFWYVPILCNPFGIISALIEPNFWNTAIWAFVCGGWVLSIIGALSGAMMGRKVLSIQTSIN